MKGRATGDDDVRRTLGLFATGVTLVTARDRLDLHAMTANSFFSISLQPLLVGVCARQDGKLQRLIRRTGSYGVSVLAADQEPAARHFADHRRPAGIAQLDGMEWSCGPVTGIPLLAGCLAWLECTLRDAIVAGDHEVLVGNVEWMARSGRSDPLLFFGSTYRRLADRRSSSTTEEVGTWTSSRAPSSVRLHNGLLTP